MGCAKLKEWEKEVENGNGVGRLGEQEGKKEHAWGGCVVEKEGKKEEKKGVGKARQQGGWGGRKVEDFDLINGQLQSRLLQNSTPGEQHIIFGNVKFA